MDSRRAYYERNRETVLARNREWEASHREQVAAGKRRRYAAKYRFSRFGLTAEQYADMLVAQNGRCALCDSADFGGSTWNVDHDHDTKEVRGLLCSGCNAALGHYEKRIRRNLRRFDEYLARSASANKAPLALVK